ncbi:MAG: DUF1493 family protein [Bacteroidetes bacterium]|nr:DUF1493 family protein [Bacteroidota bacterium]
MRETTLKKDLSLWGDDAVEFIENYGKRFNVDLSELDFKKIFSARRRFYFACHSPNAFFKEAT